MPRHFLSDAVGIVIARHRVGQIAINAARTVVSRVHARARNRLIAVHQVFALAEAIQEHGHGADIQPMRAQPHQVIQYPGNLVEHDADILSAQRRPHTEQFLDRQHVAVLVAHHGHVVEPIHVADALIERLAFGQLLGTPMQQADMRIRALNDFAVHLQHQAQHAVGRRMLRPEIHREILNLSHCRADPSGHGSITVVIANGPRHEYARFDADRLVNDPPLLRVVTHLDVADQREILAERMTDEAVVGQYAAQIRMALEQNAEQVEGFALVPVRPISRCRYTDGTSGGFSAPVKTRSRRR